MNILLIDVDTLRADRLSCYGHRRLTSPHIDGLAAGGARFTRFFSPHIPTYPGHTTMMTGRDLYTHQITGQSGTPELSAQIPMLAEMLSQEGWYTAAADNLGRWFTRGFARVEGYGWDTKDPGGLRKGEAVLQAALRVLDGAAAQDKPFFVFMHFWDPHTPYLPPAPFSRMFYEGSERNPANRSMEPVWAFENFKWYFHEWMPGVTDIEFPKAQYDAEIAYCDACLAHVFTRLEELRLADDTLVALVTDHGEELDDHGCWFDHHGLYDPNVRIPLLLRLPGRIQAGLTVDAIACMQDLTPTLLDFAGLLDPAARFDGTSLLPLLEQSPAGAPVPAERTVHLTENTWMKKRALRTAEWKLIVALQPDIHGFPPVELYDLARDPAEKRNLADERPEKVCELRQQMDEHVARRVTETGLPDPLPLQPLPLHSIGQRPAEPAADEKRADGDFIGYERDA